MKTKRIISLLLVISIIFSMTPSLSVNAAGQEPENTAATAEGAANTTPEGETNPPDETGSNYDGLGVPAPRNMMLFSNSGVNEVEYRRKNPEVAILNRYTGNSLKFYDTLTVPSSSYNGIGLFGKTVDSKLYAEGFSEDYSEDFGEDFLVYDDFKNGDNILNQLNNIKDEFSRDIDNLEAGVSGTFHNNWHTHTVSGGDAEDGFRDEEEFEVMSYSIIKLRKENTTIIKQAGKKKDYQTKPRIGNGEFASLRYHKDYPLILQLSRSVTYYSPYREFCTCGGHHVEKVVVAFRDQRAPQISEVYMKEEIGGGREYVNIYKNTQHGEYREDLVFGEDKEINIKIKYDEPIRFADDSAAGKEDLYVRLVVDGAVEGSGESIHPKAYLTKLDEDTLYFSHTVPADSEVNYTISQIDLSPLIGTGIPLKQVGPVAQYEKKTILGVEIDVIKGWKDGSFAVEVPSDVQGKALGFTESSSYITDLAGNAINNELIIPTFPFYIDTQGVEVTEIVPNFSSRHYYDIKDMLEKTNPYNEGYPDKSDTHIGMNSIFNFNITFNKTLAIGDLGKSKYSEPYTNLIATTNMKKENGEFISLKSKRADQRGPIKDLVTTISFENSPPLDSGVTCDDEDGILRVTGISYVDGAPPLKDKSGIEISLDSIKSDLMTKALYLDNKYAEVTTTLSEVGGIYKTEPMVGGEKKAFRFPFVVEDNGSIASGVNGLTGKFRWVKKTETSAVIAENWPFEYIITAKANLDGTEDWLKGYMGCKEYKFTQIEGADYYLYIRPVAGEEYSLFDTDLQFQALDYAGNKREWDDWISFPIDVVWEDQPPTASPGEVRRKLNESGDEGTIEVDILLKDQSDIKSEGASYQWLGEGETLNESLWKDAPISFASGNKEGKITATETVAAAVYGSGSTEGESFSQNLWIKVSDEFNNELTANMGLYEYNLTQVGYELGCTSAITDKASIKVEKIDSGGSLVLMVKDPNPDTTDEYFVRVFDDTVAGQEAFSHGNSWLRMKVTENNWGYEFEHLSGDNKDYINRIAGGPITSHPYFSGNLQVTVLSGRNEAFSFETITKYPLQAGNVSHPVAKETVSLRVSHNNTDYDKPTDTFPNISFSPIQTINTKPEWNADDYFWSEGDLPFLSTAEGVEFNVDLGEDKYGWNYEDINFANSYIELKYLDVAPYNTRFQAYLSSGRHQRIAFPKGDYKKGDYAVTLYVKCHVGKDYEIMISDSEGTYQTMYIDPTPASTDFGVSSLTYTPRGSQFKESYYSHGLLYEEYFNWEIDAYSNDQVIYLPAHMPEWPNILTVEINDYENLPQHGVKIWNITTGGSAEDAEFSSSQSYDRSFFLTVCDTFEEAQSERGVIEEWNKTKTKLGLVKNQDNLIAVQVCNRNGLNSQIKYYTIHPVDEEVKGSTSVSLGEDGSNVVGQGNVIFTPEPGQLMDGVRVFATAIASGESINSDGPREMVAQYDGTYTCPLTVGHNWYYIYSIDKYGNLNLYDIEKVLENQLNLYAPDAVLDKTPPKLSLIDSSAGEGMYEAVFKIEDATINALDCREGWKRPSAYMPLDISLYFDSAYTEALGVQEGMSLDLRINENEDEYVWTTKGVNPMGIYEVRAERKSDVENPKPSDYHYLEVRVKGAVAYKEDDSPQTFTLYMDAGDGVGNSTVMKDDEGNPFSISAKFEDASSAQPLPYPFDLSSSKAPRYADPNGSTIIDRLALIIEFNMPVLPESSWINPEPEYGTIQAKAFPITTNGSHTIKYYDVFGNPFTQELEIWVLDDVSLSVDISPADLTAGDVTVILKEDRDIDSPGRGMLLFKKEGDIITPIADDESTKYDIADKKQITLSENASLVVYNYPWNPYYKDYQDLLNNSALTSGHKTEIHISNIVKGAPEAKGYLYFTETGKEYAIGDELPNQTSGNIQVRYTTSRKTSPTEGTDSIHTFKYGGNSSYTFYFEDQLGLKGNLRVDLNALGVTIVKPSQLIVDDKDPIITVNMYAKQFDRYSLATVFSSGVKEESIKAAFDAMAYVQGYLFEVNVLDQSDYKIVLMKQEPQTSISYQTATSQTIEGVSLSGRTITVTEDLKEDIYVVVVDNAKAETGAEKDNYAYILLKASDMTAWFDTISPIAITEIVSNSLYEKTVYISFSDKANADSEKETGLVTLNSPKLERVIGATGATAKYNGWYKLEFYDNSNVELVFHDMAGNRGTYTISVGGIDSSKPELTVTWSPAYVSNDGEIDTSSPTLGPVNSDVKAIITADKPIMDMEPWTSLKYTIDGENWDSWPDPYFRLPPSSIDYTSNSERVIIIFKGKIDESEQVIGVRVKVVAPNGKESDKELLLSKDVIDKTAPIIEGVVTYKYREDFTAPYAAEIVLTPDEPSYCLNAGKVDTLYDSNNPLKIDTNKNEITTYRFRDKAGNLGDVDVTTENIDITPPKITTDPKNTKDFTSSTVVTVKISVDEDCKIEHGENQSFDLAENEEKELTFTENGVYSIKAFDLAGNTAVATVVIGNIDKTAPMISFDNMTIRVREDSKLSKLEDMLGEGVKVWDNLDDPKDLEVKYNIDGVEEAPGVNEIPKLDLAVPGLYTIPYTVTDTAGNEGYANRYVRVFDKDMPGVIIGDIITEPDGTIVLFQGEHKLTIEGLKTIAPGEMEPYTIKICNGIRSEGQMKYYSSTVPVDSEGNFTLSGKGFYTLYINTQSRQSYRTLLYVEK